jgi:predicted transposase YdaD
MPLPFDATLKDLVESFTPDYEAVLDLQGPTPLQALNVDLSTVTAATDIVLGRGDPPEVLVDVNFQSGWADDLLGRVPLYNALLYYRYQVPVHSIVVLLRPSANDRRLDQGVHYAVWPERGRMDFSFEVVRLWERPVERILSGGLGTLPLAPLCQMPAGLTLEQALPAVLRRIDERLAQEARPEDAAKLWTATFVLSGLRLSREQAQALFQGVRGMKESTTYQFILSEGRAEGIREVLLCLGQKRFGPPGETTKAVLDAIGDLERLKRMTERVYEVPGWQEVLDTP